MLCRKSGMIVQSESKDVESPEWVSRKLAIVGRFHSLKEQKNIIEG
jgi:hypothetical protein